MSYVGFALIKLTKCLSGDNGVDYGDSWEKRDDVKNNPFFYYEWTEWTKGGATLVQETKVNEFLTLTKSKSITQGRRGYYQPEGSTKWLPISDEMFEELNAKWLDHSTRTPDEDEDDE